MAGGGVGEAALLSTAAPGTLEAVLAGLGAGGAGAGLGLGTAGGLGTAAGMTAGAGTLAGTLAELGIPEAAMSALPGGLDAIGAGAGVPASIAANYTPVPGTLAAALKEIGATPMAGTGTGSFMGKSPDFLRLASNLARMQGGVNQMTGAGDRQRPMPSGGAQPGGTGQIPQATLGDAEKQALIQLLLKRYAMGGGTTPIMRGI